MLFLALAIHKNIIKEYKYKLPQVASKYIIHEGLKGRGCINKVEWHHLKLVVPVMSPECRLMLIAFLDPDLMVP